MRDGGCAELGEGLPGCGWRRGPSIPWRACPPHGPRSSSARWAGQGGPWLTLHDSFPRGGFVQDPGEAPAGWHWSSLGGASAQREPRQPLAPREGAQPCCPLDFSLACAFWTSDLQDYKKHVCVVVGHCPSGVYYGGSREEHRPRGRN